MSGCDNAETADGSYSYEIFFDSNYITPEMWQLFLAQVTKQIGWRKTWRIVVRPKYNTFHYYIVTPKPLPINLASSFLLKATNLKLELLTHGTKIFWNTNRHNLVTISHQLNKHNLNFAELILTFRHGTAAWSGYGNLTTQTSDQKIINYRLSLFAPTVLLSIDFSKNQNYTYKKFPKYLKVDKALDILNSEASNALLKVDTYPCAKNDFYLHPANFDFEKHSLILGSSGAGKSKLIALLVHDIMRQAADKYKVVVIDPHDDLKNDLSDITKQRVCDFRTLSSSTDLFRNNAQDINVSVELTLSLLESLFGDSYNGQIARVLRFSVYLLLAEDNLSFLTLRQLLTDLEFRARLVSATEGKVPVSVTRFFLTDYNEIKNQFYKDAIAPIITFIDEMQMVPVFNQNDKGADLSAVIAENFLTIFSLNRLSLGNKVTQTIAGLLMQQLFLLIQAKKFDQHLIIVIDEVAAIENPIIARFLSELRKYHASVILAGQYFSQISENLRASILANAANYYIFRVSKTDAEMIAQNLELKLVGQSKPEDTTDFLIHLKNRECVARISHKGELLPAFRAQTMECPDLIYQGASLLNDNHAESQSTAKSQFSFAIDANVSIQEIMKVDSTSRKKLS